MGDDINYACMTKSLHRIHDKLVAVKQKDRENTTRIICNSLRVILKDMVGSDATLASLHPKIQIMRTYFEGLQIDQPKVIDVYLELTAFLGKHARKSIEMQSLQSPLYSTLIKPGISPNINSDGLLSGDKLTKLVRSALQKCHDKQSTKTTPKLFEIVHSETDFYVKIIQQKILINLIPVISMNLDKKTRGSLVDYEKARHLGPEYLLVPQNEVDWMITFPQQEKRLLKSKYHLKFVLRLVKLLLKKQEIELTEECIKNMFLLEIEKNSATFWILKGKGYILMHMLKVLRDYLKIGAMPNYWCQISDLFEGIDGETLKLWSDKLSMIIDNINSKRGSQMNEAITKCFV